MIIPVLHPATSGWGWLGVVGFLFVLGVFLYVNRKVGRK